MTQWTPELDKLVRKFSEYQEKQMKDALNPKATVLGSALRMAFRAKAYGISTYKEVCAATGLDGSFELDAFEKNVQQIIDLATQNGSTAADKLKKALPVAQQLRKDFAAHPHDGLKNIKTAKQKNTPYI